MIGALVVVVCVAGAVVVYVLDARGAFENVLLFCTHIQCTHVTLNTMQQHRHQAALHAALRCVAFV